MDTELKAYHQPELREHGKLTEVTQDAFNDSHDTEQFLTIPYPE
ncbi:MAG: hypothetical protein P1S60_04410 [Anaerolineae bacterium]|nr:hypothetical protein [Anaerolineae bacterium]